MGATCAYVYGEWAALEAATSGSAARAAAILAKGRAAGAEPAAVLDLADRIVSGAAVPADLEAAVTRWNEAPLAAGGDETAVLAASLHDVGRARGIAVAREPHELTGARWMEERFGSRAAYLVGSHVPAKRVLVASDHRPVVVQLELGK